MEDSNCLKFPSVLCEKMSSGEFDFPENTCFSYEPIQGFRGIQREKDDFEAVSRKDFLSYAEMNVCRRGLDRKDPHYYGVSLFLNKESVENALKFPRANKKIAVGKVYSEAGPAEVNEETGHICWWLYDNVEIEGFSIC
ncbi:MAG: hypothetical protein HDR00_15630 [Lachnospiraceae bacterium]|nr:hypothetical protein [Lachnospiraceae bacterium]